MLIAQYAQSEQISALQKKIQQSNDISRQILENQLKEIQYKEKMKYYKALAYNMDEATSLISKETDPALQVFLGNLFLEPIALNIKESKDNLEDISDKSFCKEIENKISNIKEHINKNGIKYQESEFPNLINWETYYDEKKNNLENCKIETVVQLAKIRDKRAGELKVKPYNNPFRILGIIFLSILLLLFILIAFEDLNALIIGSVVLSILLFFIYKDRKWKKNYPLYLSSMELLKKNDKEKYGAIENEMIQKEAELEAHPYMKTKNIISLQYPNWQEKIESIYSFLPKEEKEQKRRDPLFFEAVKLVIKHQMVSQSLFQRRFSIKYNRANEINT